MKRIQKAWGHKAHRGYARFLLDRARDLIHGPTHRGDNGEAMPTDKDDQDGLFFLVVSPRVTDLYFHNYFCSNSIKILKQKSRE